MRPDLPEGVSNRHGLWRFRGLAGGDPFDHRPTTRASHRRYQKVSLIRAFGPTTRRIPDSHATYDYRGESGMTGAGLWLQHVGFTPRGGGETTSGAGGSAREGDDSPPTPSVPVPVCGASLQAGDVDDGSSSQSSGLAFAP